MWPAPTPGYLGAQDTYYVGKIKGVGRIYQQTYIDTFSKVDFSKLYDRKNALVAADLLNDRVLPSIEDIEHAFTKAKSPQTNGICERFHKTVQQEFYAVTFRKKIYKSIEELQHDLDQWLQHYNNQRTPSG